MRACYRADKYIELADWLSAECGNDKEALVWIDRALALEPENPEALVVKGDILQNMDRFSESIHFYDRALELEPNAADAVAEKAQALCAMGRWQESLHLCDRGFALIPEVVTDAEASFWQKVGEILYDAKAHCLYELGRSKLALETLKEGMERYPSSQILSGPYGELHNAFATLQAARSI